MRSRKVPQLLSQYDTQAHYGKGVNFEGVYMFFMGAKKFKPLKLWAWYSCIAVVVHCFVSQYKFLKSRVDAELATASVQES